MLKIFDGFNNKSVCKICGINKSGKSVLIPIVDTRENGSNICQAEQVHLDCLDLMWANVSDRAVIIQVVKIKDDE